MEPEDWYFLVDENLEPRVVELLENEGYRADRVGDDALFQGADDRSDVLPFAVEHDAVVLTNDWTDFTSFDPTEHNGILIVFDNGLSAWRIVELTMKATKAFGHPDNCSDWYKLERFESL